MALRSVKDADGKGWLRVRHANGSEFPPLPQKLKVDLTRTDGGREYFTIQEGRMKGGRASVKVPAAAGSYLEPRVLHEASGTIRFDKKKEQLWYGSTGPIAAITDETNPVPDGTFNLEIPYEAHALAVTYESQSRFAKTWFRIGHEGDRFLHPGRVSAGCITVTDIPGWTAIYAYLIGRRANDTISVGIVEVTS
ncbi:MAG: hypothetical protein AAGI53_03065 [Planctomycetota bacterium]